MYSKALNRKVDLNNPRTVQAAVHALRKISDKDLANSKNYLVTPWHAKRSKNDFTILFEAYRCHETLAGLEKRRVELAEETEEDSLSFNPPSDA